MKGDIVNNLQVYEYPRFDTTQNQELSETQIKDFIDSHQIFVSKFTENINFYIGKNIQFNHDLDVYAPSNEINVPYARTMTQTVKGFMFKPNNIKYDIEDELDVNTEEYFDNLKDIFKNNNEHIKNSELGEHQSKFGIAFELLYTKQNEDGITIPYFIIVDPREIIPIYDYTIDKNLFCAIRYYETGKTDKNEIIKKVEIYYKNKISYYSLTETKKVNSLFFLSETPNYFYDVPLVIYKNNNEILSDYEPTKTLIELYDKLMSDSANEFDRFASAYMVFQNYILGGNREENREKMENIKKLRVFEIDSDGDIKFLTKDIPTAFFQEVKVSLKSDIVYHSHIPDFRDETFGTASGVAIQYKLIGFENLCSDKEAYFRQGLERRLKLINNFLKIQRDIIDISKINITFTRNLPDALGERVEVVSKLKGIISEQTLLSLLPFIKDVNQEIEKMKKEQEEANSQFDIENIDNNQSQDQSIDNNIDNNMIDESSTEVTNVEENK